MKMMVLCVLFLGSIQIQAQSLKLESAQKIVNKAIECGKKSHWNLSVTIVNAEGRLLAFARMDDSYVGSVQASMDKAISSNAFQRPTKVFADAVNNDGRVGLLSVKDVVANEGGLPINISGKHAGAIGISGAKAIEDEQCAYEALKEIK